MKLSRNPQSSVCTKSLKRIKFNFKLKIKMMLNQYSFQIQRPTHRISVRSNVKGSPDTRTFSVIAPINTEEVYFIVKHFFEVKSKEVFAEKIQYTQAEKKSTHNVVILPLIAKEKSKCYSVKLGSYSSLELANEIHKFLCSGMELGDE